MLPTRFFVINLSVKRFLFPVNLTLTQNSLYLTRNILKFLSKRAIFQFQRFPKVTFQNLSIFAQYLTEMMSENVFVTDII